MQYLAAEQREFYSLAALSVLRLSIFFHRL